MTSYDAAPPSTYYEDDEKSYRFSDSNHHELTRKPTLPPRPTMIDSEDPGSAMMMQKGRSADDYVNDSMARLDLNHSQRDYTKPDLSVDTYARLQTGETRPNMNDAAEDSYAWSPASSVASITPSSTFSGATSTSPSSTNMQKALQEARHFAGGLISHPSESNKHYSILRHSHGLVFYQGPNTTLAISIFADTILPPSCTIWMQSKGWTGKTGMKVKALFGMDGKWINVTPCMSVAPHQVKSTDERAWQRDITRFQKKSIGRKRESHILRTTAIVRIPAEAQDGYFQLVLCQGDKERVLATSPSFRVLSTSTSPHSLRGASFLTMPLEAGAMAVGLYAKATAGRVVGPVVSIATGSVQKYMPSHITQKVASTAYNHSKVGGKMNSAMDDIRMQSIQGKPYSVIDADTDFEHGPTAPYPVSLIAKCHLSRTEHTDLLCLKVRDLPENLARNLHGYYFGWARYVTVDKKLKEIISDWNQVVISVLAPDASQLVHASITEAHKKHVTIQFMPDSEDLPPSECSLEIKIMGCLRPDDPEQRAHLASGLKASDEAAVQAAIAVYMDDVSTAQTYLDHPSWDAEYVPDHASSQKPGGLARLKSGFAEVATAAQTQMDKVPFSKMGIRSAADRVRDKSVGVSGFWVTR